MVGETIKLLGDHLMNHAQVNFESPPPLPKGKGSADLVKQPCERLPKTRRNQVFRAITPAREIDKDVIDEERNQEKIQCPLERQ